MSQDPENRFDDAALHHLAQAAYDPDVSMSAYEQELEKIAAWYNPFSWSLSGAKNWLANSITSNRAANQALGAAWHNVPVEDYTKMTGEASLRNFRERLGLPAAAAPAAADAANPSFFNTHFGTQHLQAPAGSAPGAGISNWWQNTSDAQKLKTFGVAGLGLGATGVAANMAMGNRRQPQINMGPTVTGY